MADEREGIAVVALCPDCYGLKGAETEDGNQEAFRRWLDRGDVLGARSVRWVREAGLCKCFEREA